MGDYKEAMWEIEKAKELLQRAYRKIEYAGDEGVKNFDTLLSIEEAINKVKILEHSTELLWEKWQDE